MLMREGTHKSEGKRSRQLIVLWCIADHLVSVWLQAAISVPPKQWCFWALWSFYRPFKVDFFGAKARWSGAWRRACFSLRLTSWSLGSTATVSAWVWNHQETLLPQVFYANIAETMIIIHTFYCSSSSNVRMVVLIVFCSQGDNIQDAVSLTEHLDQWISVKQYLVRTVVMDKSVAWHYNI